MKRYRITRNPLYQPGTVGRLLNHVNATEVRPIPGVTHEDEIFEASMDENTLEWFRKLGSAHSIQEVHSAK